MKTFKTLLHEPLVRIILTIVVCGFTYSFLPLSFIRGALTLSIFLKGLLMFFVPFLILSGTAIAFGSFKGNGLWLVVTIMGIIVVCNFCNLMLSGLFGCYVIPHFAQHDPTNALATSNAIEPYFMSAIPQILPNGIALIIGIISGIASTVCNLSKWMNILRSINRATMFFLSKIFIPTLPLFLMGFILKMLNEGQMSHFFKTNGYSCLIMFCFLFSYLGLWWLAAHRCSGIPAATLLKNIAPAALTGFSTMSSMAALPFAIESATKNTKDPVLANAVMPIALNFHMLGCSTCIPMLAIMVLSSFSMPLPNITTYLLFGLMFMLNKFAGAGIPGGTIMVSLPILKTYFGFSDEMQVLITTFYMLIEPVGTMANVTANNFLIIFIQKAWSRIAHKA